MMFLKYISAGTAGYSLAKKNYPVLSELQVVGYTDIDKCV